VTPITEWVSISSVPSDDKLARALHCTDEPRAASDFVTACRSLTVLKKMCNRSVRPIEICNSVQSFTPKKSQSDILSGLASGLPF
jgi:hypothetical protein